MIEYLSGDILKDESEALVNTVNCVGVMGRGIALQFKKVFPRNFEEYVEACEQKKVRPGHMFVFDTGQITMPRFIINFPTKRHWRGESRMEDIESGLSALVEVIRKRNIRSVAVPPLGSGLGGLKWEDVRKKIEAFLSELKDVRVRIYQPKGAPSPESMSHVHNVPKMTTARAAVVEFIQSYLKGLLDPFISLLEVHKLMYFLQEAGEDLRLRYMKAHYGPYAENLGHLLHKIEGHFITGYADGGDAPSKQLKLLPGAVHYAEEYLKSHPETKKRFDRVTNLVKGFESPFGMELLSTVHWILRGNDSPKSLDEIVDKVYAWNQYKHKFSESQIKIAIEVLTKQGWAKSIN